jgi:hypothetical protein
VTAEDFPPNCALIEVHVSDVKDGDGSHRDRRHNIAGKFDIIQCG